MRRSVGTPISWASSRNRASILCLVGSLVTDETEKWAKQRRSRSAEDLAKLERVGFADARAVADDGTEHDPAVSTTPLDRGRITRWSREHFSEGDPCT